MSAADAPPPAPPRCLRAALRAYPAVDRDLYGGDLIDAAADLAASGSVVREVGGLLRGGLSARVRRVRAGLMAFDRQAAGDALVEPLTGAVVAIFGAAAIARMAGAIGSTSSARAGITVGAVVLLVELALLVVAVARRQRGLAAGAATALLFQAALSAGWAQWRGDIVTAAPQLHLHVGDWWFGPSLVWSIVPFVALLVLCCLAMTPAAARLAGARRAPREWSEVRLAALFAPSAAMAAVLVLQPSILLGPDAVETTEVPGVAFLILIVGAFWLATSSPGGRDHLAAAAALLGLAAVPSVAYGFADLVTPTLDGLGTPTTRLAVVLVLSSVVVLVSVAVFLAALAAVGLRTGAGAPPHLAVAGGADADIAESSDWTDLV